MNKSNWLQLIILSFILIFSIPAITVFKIPELVNYGINITLSFIGLIFFLYPFYAAIRLLQAKEIRFGILLIVFGVIAPLFSGLVCIVAFEISGRYSLKGNNHAV